MDFLNILRKRFVIVVGNFHGFTVILMISLVV